MQPMSNMSVRHFWTMSCLEKRFHDTLDLENKSEAGYVETCPIRPKTLEFVGEWSVVLLPFFLACDNLT